MGTVLLSTAAFLLLLPGVAAAQDTTLVAKKVAAGPALDGKMDAA